MLEIGLDADTDVPIRLPGVALEHLRSSVVSVSLLGEPVGSTLLAVFVLSEAPTLFTVGGGAVVLVSSWRPYVTLVATAHKPDRPFCPVGK